MAVDDMVREEFWRAQFPQVSIRPGSAATLDPQHSHPVARNRERMAKEGYFDGRDDGLQLRAPLLADVVERCAALGFPPVFVFLFDEAWHCFSLLHPVVSSMLGDGYRWLPDFWAWRVGPQGDERGWKPHRDRGYGALAPDGTPLSLTLWIPLTEATPVTSCICVLPANRDPTYGTPREDEWQFDLPDLRALPAGPGEFLCWNQAVLHWGSRASPYATRPRVSMALECQRGDAPALNEPLLTPSVLLPFDARLRLVAKQLLQYRHLHALRPDLEALALRCVAPGFTPPRRETP